MELRFPYLRSLWPAIARPGYLFSTCLLTAILIYANYAGRLQFRWLLNAPGYTALLIRAFALYAIPYWLVFTFQYLFFPNLSFHRDKWWWVIVLSAPALFACRTTFHLLDAPIRDTWAAPYRVFYFNSAGYLVRALFLIVPITVIWMAKDRIEQPPYGLKKPATWAYTRLLLLFVIPLLIIAIRQPSFLLVYPKAACLFPIPTPTWASHWYYVVFEACYAMDLFSMEFFFRGLLVLGLFQVCKEHALLPAAVFYCTIHFGKPFAECVSSFFGAIMLGMLAIRTGSIYGGVLLHVLLAFGLEVLCCWIR